MSNRQMMLDRPVRARHRQRGLTLVEIMVALAISLVLVLGAIQIFVGDKQAYRVQDSLAEQQENGRYAVSQIGHALRMADQWGALEADAVGVDSGVSVTGTCGGTNWAVSRSQVKSLGQGYGVYGKEGAAASPFAACIPDADYLPNTDILVVRYGDGTAVPDTSVGTGSNATKLFVRSTVGRSATIMTGTAAAALSPSVDTFNYPYQIEIYFIRPCANMGANGVCDASDDNGSPIPTLTRLTLNGSTLQQQALVEGVENLQIEYGIDTDNNYDANLYETADKLSASDWDKVVAVRFSVLVRSNTLDMTHNDTQTYTMAGGVNASVPNGAEHYYRKVYMQLVQLRNRSRG